MAEPELCRACRLVEREFINPDARAKMPSGILALQGSSLAHPQGTFALLILDGST